MHHSFVLLEAISSGRTPIFTNDAIVLGLLALVLSAIFVSSGMKRFQKFYRIVPSLLLCYFVPAFLNYPLNLISPEYSKLYFIASRYLLPASLVLLTLSVDMKGIINLGPKALITFLAGTVGVIIGGPIALLLVSWIAPEAINNAGVDEVWRGLSTIAGSWIGGGANQTAMKEVFAVKDTIFSAMIIVDVFVANIWMAFLLFGAGRSKWVDRLFNADAGAIEELKDKMVNYQKSVMKIPTTSDLMKLMAVAFGITALAHGIADVLAPFFLENHPLMARFSLTEEFFWIIVVATTVGFGLSFTKIRQMEGYGASRLGSVFLYFLIATIGMKMDIYQLYLNWATYKWFILIGLIWILTHIIILLTVAKIIKAPFFFTAVGSQANIGGAASAPIVASAFHPSLASVGVLLAVFGYVIGTYGAWLCAIVMQSVSVGG